VALQLTASRDVATTIGAGIALDDLAYGCVGSAGWRSPSRCAGAEQCAAPAISLVAQAMPRIAGGSWRRDHARSVFQALRRVAWQHGITAPRPKARTMPHWAWLWPS
jgi:hypothetical protein